MKLLAMMLTSLALLFQAGVAYHSRKPDFRVHPQLRTLDERTEQVIAPPPVQGAEVLIVTRDPFYR